jgi:outer membrane protein assembly complex protein YaeT
VVLAQQPYFGTTVSSIRISGDTSEIPLDNLPVRVGQPLTPESIRESIQRLYDTGRYRAIEVDAEPSGGGTQITFNVTRHTFFSTFRLVPDLLGRPLSGLLRLPVGQRFSESRVEEVLEQTRTLLRDAGYFDANLTPVIETDSKRELRAVELRVDAKEKARVQSVTVQTAPAQTVLPEEEILDAFGVRPRDFYSADSIDRGANDVRSKLVDRNYVSAQVRANPQYDPQSNSVTVELMVDAGQPTIVDAGDALSRDEVRRLLPVFEEGAFDAELLREGRDRIVQHMQERGYFEASVQQPVVVSSGTEGPVRIRLSIEPGERHRVNSVRFEGNTFFTSEQLLARTRVRPAVFPELLSRGTFTNQLLEADVVALRTLYRRAGFEAAFVEGRRVDLPNREIDVIYEITENLRYPVEDLVFTGNSKLTEEELRNVVRLKEGSMYAPADADDDRTALMAFYYENGFPEVTIEVTADRNPGTGGRTITYRIEEGRRFRVGELLVAGNTRTAEKVVKRASGLKEYTWFNPEHVLEAEQRLYATGLFSHVDVVPLDGDSGDLKNILIQIDEGKAILLIPGLGYKEDAGPRATLDISHNNLLGLDRSMNLRFRVGVGEQQFQATYREPRLLNRDDLDGYLTLLGEKRDRKDFEAKRLEVGLQVRKRISPGRSLLGLASYQTVDLEDIKVNPIVRLFPDAQGVVHIAKIGGSFLTDSRDDALDPRSGMFTRTELQFAGRRWGSEVDFVSVFQQTGLYRPAGLGTIAFSTRIGFKNPYGEDHELPITERYFAGGSTTLRGFSTDEAGPPGGGQLMTLANLEYRVPFKTLSIGEIGGAFFYDSGNVFEQPSQFSFGDFTNSAGLGLRFLTPLGPIRFDVGFNLNPRLRVQRDGSTKREETVKAFFTLGHAF